MRREDIVKEAQNYEDGLIYKYISEQYDVQKAFVEGAEWRINRVWHSDTEKPDIDKGDLLVGIEVMGKTAYIRQNAYYVIQFGCIRWAYIKDLIPNTEE